MSKRLIQFIVDPAKKERNDELREERGGTKFYYSKEKHRAYMQTHRKHKQEVLKNVVGE